MIETLKKNLELNQYEKLKQDYDALKIQFDVINR